MNNPNQYNQARQMAWDAYELLAGGFIEGHLHGLELLEQARRLCPQAVKDVDTEIEQSANH